MLRMSVMRIASRWGGRGNRKTTSEACRWMNHGGSRGSDMNKDRIIDNLFFIMHLAAEGKLDKLDFQILVLKKAKADMGKKMIAGILAKHVATVAYRLKRMRKLLK
jgi:hypothetical protein